MSNYVTTSNWNTLTAFIKKTTLTVVNQGRLKVVFYTAFFILSINQKTY